MVFDFDESFDLEPGGRHAQAQPRQWAVVCEPSPSNRKKPSARPAGRKKKSKGREAAEALLASGGSGSHVQAGLEGVELPPSLARYGARHKYFSGPSLLGVENDEGRVEYKLRLKEDTTPQRFHQLVTQLKFRLSEGEGECFYLIGVEDNGHPKGLPPHQLQESLEVLQRMAREAGAAATVLRTPGVEEGRLCAVVSVREQCSADVQHEDLRIAVAGAVDSGKSSLVSVLTQGSEGRPLLDNGRGCARMAVFQHKHEIESGHTSSLTQQALGYDSAGRVVNYRGVSAYTPAELAQVASKVVRFVDTGGHEKYAKTALHGLTATLPDYALICACAVAGVSWVTREHLAVALALGVPAFVALTKADLAADEAALDCAVEDIRCLVGAALGPAAPADLAEVAPVVESEEEARQLAPLMLSARLGAAPAPGAAGETTAEDSTTCEEHGAGSPGPPRLLLLPIFKVSSVTGRGLDALHAFMHALRPETARLEQGVAAAAAGSLAALAGGVAAERAQQAPEGCAAPAGPPAATSTAAAEEGCFQGWFRAGGGSGSGSSSSAAAGAEGAPAAQEGPGQEAGGAGSSSTGASSTAPAASLAPEPQLAHFQIDQGLQVAGVGPVYSGRVVAGTLRVGSALLLGPCQGEGGAQFRRARVSGLHRSQVPVECITQGHIATVAVELLEGEEREVEGGGEEQEVQHQQEETQQQQEQQEQQQDGGETAADGMVSPASSGSASEEAPTAELTAAAATAALGAVPAQALAPAAELTAVGSGSAPAEGLAGTCWDLSEHLGSRRELLGVSSRPRTPFPKASVLLDPRIQPQPQWEFEAVLVLLGGQWPARGLMSGRWPPEEEGAEPLETPGSLPGRGSAGGSGSTAAAKRLPAVYSAVVHCGSIRQAAQVVSIQELPQPQQHLLPSPGSSCSQQLPPSPPSADPPGAAEGSALALPPCGWQCIMPALAAARLLRAVGWVPSGPSFLAGSSVGSLPRLEGLGGSQAVPFARPPLGRQGQEQRGRSPGDGAAAAAGGWWGMAGSQGGLSSTWSGESLGQLSGASSDSYDSSASESFGGRSVPSAPGSEGRRRVVWAEGLADAGAGAGGHAAGCTGSGRGEAAEGQREPPQQQEQQQQQGEQGRRGLLPRHPSLSAARSDPDLGCVARVRLRFISRREWLVEGARLVVRDRGGGRAAAVGYVLVAEPGNGASS